MNYTFDFKKMELLLQNFSNICGVRYSLINNDNKIVCHSKELSTFCQKVSSTKEGLERCRGCDKVAINHAVRNKFTYYSYRCHAGILETVIPIWFQEESVGTIMLGQYIHGEDLQEQWEASLTMLSKWYQNAESLKQDFYDLIVMDRSVIVSSCKILIACSNYICGECIIRTESSPILQALYEYIEAHYQSKITLDELSVALGVSKTSLCNLASKNQTTINAMIKKHRISIARELLRTTYYSVGEVGEKVGISDYNYFTKLFKSECGCTPSEYKKHAQEKLR